MPSSVAPRPRRRPDPGLLPALARPLTSPCHDAAPPSGQPQAWEAKAQQGRRPSSGRLRSVVPEGQGAPPRRTAQSWSLDVVGQEDVPRRQPRAFPPPTLGCGRPGRSTSLSVAPRPHPVRPGRCRTAPPPHRVKCAVGVPRLRRVTSSRRGVTARHAGYREAACRRGRGRTRGRRLSTGDAPDHCIPTGGSCSRRRSSGSAPSS